MATINAKNQPTAASGRVLQGQGVGTASAFSTATYPSTSVGSGKILYDNGTNFVTSVPTFPASASATSRKIIVSDGTNWVASTETYATPGTSGNVLTSDGTNWTSAAAPGAGLITTTGTLTSAQIKSLNATPVQAIAAPGAGNVIVVVSANGKMNYGGTNVFTAAVAQIVRLYWGTTQVLMDLMPTARIISSSTQFTNPQNISTSNGANTLYDNVAVNFWQFQATEIGGNAANNNTITYTITYRIVTI
jgi:hypothetical protein